MLVSLTSSLSSIQGPQNADLLVESCNKAKGLNEKSKNLFIQLQICTQTITSRYESIITYDPSLLTDEVVSLVHQAALNLLRLWMKNPSQQISVKVYDILYGMMNEATLLSAAEHARDEQELSEEVDPIAYDEPSSFEREERLVSLCTDIQTIPRDTIKIDSLLASLVRTLYGIVKLHSDLLTKEISDLIAGTIAYIKEHFPLDTTLPYLEKIEALLSPVETAPLKVTIAKEVIDREKNRQPLVARYYGPCTLRPTVYSFPRLENSFFIHFQHLTIALYQAIMSSLSLEDLKLSLSDLIFMGAFRHGNRSLPNLKAVTRECSDLTRSCSCFLIRHFPLIQPTQIDAGHVAVLSSERYLFTLTSRDSIIILSILKGEDCPRECLFSSETDALSYLQDLITTSIQEETHQAIQTKQGPLSREETLQINKKYFPIEVLKVEISPILSQAKRFGDLMFFKRLQDDFRFLFGYYELRGLTQFSDRPLEQFFSSEDKVTFAYEELSSLNLDLFHRVSSEESPITPLELELVLSRLLHMLPEKVKTPLLGFLSKLTDKRVYFQAFLLKEFTTCVVNDYDNKTVVQKMQALPRDRALNVHHILLECYAFYFAQKYRSERLSSEESDLIEYLGQEVPLQDDQKYVILLSYVDKITFAESS